MPLLFREALDDQRYPVEEARYAGQIGRFVPRVGRADKEHRVTTAEEHGEPGRQTRRYLTGNRESSREEGRVGHEGESSTRFRVALPGQAWRISSPGNAFLLAPRLVPGPNRSSGGATFEEGDERVAEDEIHDEDDDAETTLKRKKKKKKKKNGYFIFFFFLSLLFVNSFNERSSHEIRRRRA